MFRLRLLWGCVGIVSLVVQTSAFGAKPQEKAPLPEENSRPAELVKIGLEAGLAGNRESRQLHLQAALDLQPEYAPAHWHLGKVRVGEEWLPVASASATISKTPQYSFYRAKRDELDGSVKRELLLARWCEQEGMSDRSQYHYGRLLRNPAVDEKTAKEAVNKLDLVAYDGELRPREEALELAHERGLEEASWGKWAKKFAEWQRAIDGSNEAKQTYAHEQLLKIDEFHVTPLIESYLPTASEKWSRELLSLLAKFPQPVATAALTRYAVLSPHEAAREQAIAELKNRKLHDFVPMLMVGLSPNTRSQFLVTVDGNANVTYQHFVEQETLDERKVLGQEVQTAVKPVVVTEFTQGPKRNPTGRKVDPLRGPEAAAVAQLVARQEAQKSLAQAQLVERQVALRNAMASVHNERFFIALEKTTNQVIAREPALWWKWWKEYNEAQFSKPTSVQVARSYQVVKPAIYQQSNVPLPTQPKPNVFTPRRPPPPWVDTTIRTSCFVAGTKVRSEAGLQGIEELRPGDRVLSQDPTSGELAYKLVLDVSRTPMSKLRRLTLGNEEIVTTPGHPFWVNGSGWKMAKELQVGERIHTLQGSMEVHTNVEPLQQDSVHNLIVADFSTYFVGEVGALVHDIPYRQPTLATVPGLVVAGQ
jgi:Pretoxin HINT domain